MKKESDSSAGPLQSAVPAESSLRRNLSWLFMFALGFAGYLFFARPVTTTAQLMFRIGLLLAGAGGLLSLAIFWPRRK